MAKCQKPMYRTSRNGAGKPWRIEQAAELAGPWHVIATCVKMDDAGKIVAALSRMPADD